jgi:glycosyltransferase involved in cell wall biosynthesis
MLTSVVIRTYNEEKHLDELLGQLRRQRCASSALELVLVDSGSTDGTLEIAQRHGCRITHIAKDDFTFGRSLNIGCDFARGELLAFVSGHCVPVDQHWLDRLVAPLLSGQAEYSYGRQLGHGPTKFSERCHFDKWFPEYSKVPQQDFFCNNANAALTRSAWSRFRFDEELTGLEDMFLARKLVEAGGKVAYVADAGVYHIHDETWRQVRLRYEREAIALQRIMPEVHFSLLDFLVYYVRALVSDMGAARRAGLMPGKTFEIATFRLMQYWGTWRGNHEHRKLSASRKHNYFYPRDLEKHAYEPPQDRGPATDESQQRTGQGQEFQTPRR